MDYTPAERQVFQFYNGATPVWGDPLEIHDRLTDLLDGDPARVLADTVTPGAKDTDGNLLDGQSDPPIRYEAKRRLDAAVVKAFDMVPFDPATGQGSSRSDRALALDAFCRWMDAHKKKHDGLPTSPAPDSLPSGDPTTPPSSACG